MNGKRIYRSRNDRVIAGVASGLAEYLNIDPLFIRLAFLLLTLVNGIGAVLYLVFWLLVPNAESTAADTREQMRESVEEMRSAAERVIERIRNMLNQPTR